MVAGLLEARTARLNNIVFRKGSGIEGAQPQNLGFDYCRPISVTQRWPLHYELMFGLVPKSFG